MPRSILKDFAFDRRCVMLFTLTAILALLAVPAFGQQSYVSRYDAYVGYAYLNSPHVSLGEHGFQFQVGVRP